MSDKIVFNQQFNQYQLLIRYPQLSDVEALRDYINEISQEQTFIRKQGEIVNLEQEKKYVENVLSEIEKKQAVKLLAFHNNKLIGNSKVRLDKLTQKHIGSFGITVRKTYRGQGIGTLLMKLTLQEALKNLPGLEIFKLTVHATNHKAIHLYQKLGFVKFGRLPNGVKTPNGYRDYIYMYKPAEKHQPAHG